MGRSGAFILHATTFGIHLILLVLCGCTEEQPLDPSRAEAIVRAHMFERQPAYAEVPMTVRWGPEYPKDDFDERSLSTLEKLENAGLVSVSRVRGEGGMTVVSAETTPEGFRQLGTVPSARGPAFRGRIAEKVIDDLRNFRRHPSEPLVGRIEVLWHYENPTPLYDLFDTRQDKPLNVPFVSVVSLSKTEEGWNVDLIVPKKSVQPD